jgi:transposase
MSKDSAKEHVIGIDQGDRWSHLCRLDENGEVSGRGRIRTTRDGYGKHFGGTQLRCRVILEVGTHSPWASRLLKKLGYEVVVANARRVQLISHAERKTDRVDAEALARLGRADPALLAPIQHGSEDAQRDLALLRIREGLVRSRVRLIQQARGIAKALGERLPACSVRAFTGRVRAAGLHQLVPGFDELFETIDGLRAQIRKLDEEVERACRERHPETLLLRQVTGVGPLTALAYVLKVEDPTRFSRSREVGPFVGLAPRARQSGNYAPQLGVPPRGDDLLRRLLVQAAHYILGPFGPDTDLRRFGLRLLERGGKRAKKRAVVAVARKLAVLLHQLWVTGEVYEPLGYGQNGSASMAA